MALPVPLQCCPRGPGRAEHHGSRTRVLAALRALRHLLPELDPRGTGRSWSARPAGTPGAGEGQHQRALRAGQRAGTARTIGDHAAGTGAASSREGAHGPRRRVRAGVCIDQAAAKAPAFPAPGLAGVLGDAGDGRASVCEFGCACCTRMHLLAGRDPGQPPGHVDEPAGGVRPALRGLRPGRDAGANRAAEGRRAEHPGLRERGRAGAEAARPSDRRKLDEY